MSMEKIVYLLRAPKDRSRERTRILLLETCAPGLLDAGAGKLVMHIADPDSEVRSPAPRLSLERPFCAAVGAWIEKTDGNRELEGVLRSEGFETCGYLVEESIYTDYGGNRHSGPRSWPDGTRSPGVTALTMMERPKGLAREEWIHRWHDTMSPVSEKIQPRTRYVRNLVVMPLTPGAPPFEGIVEESWPSKRHVTNPFLFYGARNPWELARNTARILRAATSFLDLWKIRTVMMSEYFVKTDFPDTPPRRGAQPHTGAT